MPHFQWNGPGQMTRIDLNRKSAPEVSEPSSPDLVVDDEQEVRHVCTVEDCGKKFKKRMLVARHFNSAHSDIKEDKDTWRDHTEEVWV